MLPLILSERGVQARVVMLDGHEENSQNKECQLTTAQSSGTKDVKLSLAESKHTIVKHNSPSSPQHGQTLYDTLELSMAILQLHVREKQD